MTAHGRTTTQPSRVGILQASVGRGGRLRVVAEIARQLNKRGVTPDLITFALQVDPGEIGRLYGLDAEVKPRLLRRGRGLGVELSSMALCVAAQRLAAEYDLLISTNNVLAFLPRRARMLSYVFYPREDRVLGPHADMHRPGWAPPMGSRRQADRWIARLVLRLDRGTPGAAHQVVAQSEFAALALRRRYPLLHDLRVVHPPVDVARLRAPERGHGAAPRAGVVSVGRFTPAKRQLEQIAIAPALGDTTLHLAGFTGDSDYYERCAAAASGPGSVALHPDVAFHELVALLQRAKYFLHALWNEPFGLTTVQAIAAGCVPLVHDSGGGRETVPVDWLRFTDLSAVPGIIDRFEHMAPARQAALRRRLQEHIRRFDVGRFRRQVDRLLVETGFPDTGEAASAGPLPGGGCVPRC